MPRTLGELQLYRILQRANLLSYYEAFIQQGGDDVQQLCEAAEEEFLEIMALVGMASKPLHVRRLQKALRDWVTNPALFNQPLASLPVCSIPVYKLEANGNSNASAHVTVRTLLAAECVGEPMRGAAASGVGGEGRGCSASGSPVQSGSEPRFWGSLSSHGGGGGGAESEQSLSPAELTLGLGSPSPSSPRGEEVLDAAALKSLAECVERLAQALPRSDPSKVKEGLRGNKKLSKVICHILDMEEEDPRRAEEIRKYSAIYGRFDSKRKDGKHFTLHEVDGGVCACVCLYVCGISVQKSITFSDIWELDCCHSTFKKMRTSFITRYNNNPPTALLPLSSPPLLSSPPAPPLLLPLLCG